MRCRLQFVTLFLAALRRGGGWNLALHEALFWWRNVLQQEVVEERPWHAPATPLAHLFVDARGAPARCAAVLLIDGQRLYTDGEVVNPLNKSWVLSVSAQITK